MTTWFEGIEKCPVCNAELPSMRANDGWWGCEECGFEVESAEAFQKRTGFVPAVGNAYREINERYDAMLQEYQESQSGPQVSHEEYEDYKREIDRAREKELDDLWIANQKPDSQPSDGIEGVDYYEFGGDRFPLDDA